LRKEFGWVLGTKFATTSSQRPEGLGPTNLVIELIFLFQTKTRKANERENAQKLVELFGYFTRPFDLEVAQGIQAGEDAFSEAVAKIVATRQLATEKTARPDHLGELKKVIEATADLRAKSGKLSASQVASVFGLSVAELGAFGWENSTNSVEDARSGLPSAASAAVRTSGSGARGSRSERFSKVAPPRAGRTEDASTVATAAVWPSSVMNSISKALPSA
jgi:hypothetical protein